MPTGTWFIPLVETGIALSIVHAAAVSLIAIGHRMTTLVTAALGLLHGLGFSFVLSEILNLESDLCSARATGGACPEPGFVPGRAESPAGRVLDLRGCL